MNNDTKSFRNSQHLLAYCTEQLERKESGEKPLTPGNRKPRSGFKTKVCYCRPPSLSELCSRDPKVEYMPLKDFVEMVFERYGMTRNTVYYIIKTHKNWLATNRCKGKRYVNIIPECEPDLVAWLERNKNKRKPKYHANHSNGYYQ